MANINISAKTSSLNIIIKYFSLQMKHFLEQDRVSHFINVIFSKTMLRIVAKYFIVFTKCMILYSCYGNSHLE